MAEEETKQQKKVPWLLMPNAQRFVLFPIQYPAINKMYKDAEACFWTMEQIDLSKDKKDWDALKPEEREFLKMILAFFAASDGIVIENLAARFLHEVQVPEARQFYSFQIMMEAIHSETYSALIDKYITDSQERKDMFEAIQKIPTIAKKAAWCEKWIEKSDCYAERLVAFAVVEGVFFISSFTGIFWLKKRGLLPGLAQANDEVARDESLHCEFACLLYNSLEEEFRLSEERVLQIVCEGVEIELEFVDAALPQPLLDLEANEVQKHVKFMGDKLLNMLNYKKKYNVKSRYDYLGVSSLKARTNFFEKRVVDYQKFGVGKRQAEKDDDGDEFEGAY